MLIISHGYVSQTMSHCLTTKNVLLLWIITPILVDRRLTSSDTIQQHEIDVKNKGGTVCWIPMVCACVCACGCVCVRVCVGAILRNESEQGASLVDIFYCVPHVPGIRDHIPPKNVWDSFCFAALATLHWQSQHWSEIIMQLHSS